MTAVGDIVAVPGRQGVWTVMAREPSPDARPRWRLRQARGDHFPTGLVVGEAAMTHVASPTFEPGQQVRLVGETGTVVADEGDKVRVAFTRRREVARNRKFYPGGVFVDTSGVSPVDRATLVSENVGLFT